GPATALGFAVDHKRLQDGDQGPNTGGMGCYTPVPWLPEDASEQVMKLVVEPLLKELAKRSMTYTGCLYVGLMWGSEGPSVVEFNVRLGDPEAEVLARHDQRDWTALIAAKLGLSSVVEDFEDRAHDNIGATVGVVLASPCYPYGDSATRSFEVPASALLNKGPGPLVFAAAVRLEGERLMSGKGRLLTVVGHGKDFASARHHAYQEIKQLVAGWPGVQYRRDIGENV
ncbi:MAG: phosphoribosylamine--glycine ligase, partial [Proteobacteria bacterium]|nr:phosphoribosylamine--glycine ligase [Pseudomonadota bacterium]